MTYEATYEFPLGSGSLRKLDIQAESEEEARRKLGIVNPTLKFTPVERNPVARYLKSDDGQQFVKLLKDFESTIKVQHVGRRARKEERLEARISPAQKDLIERAAALRGTSVTEFVVSSAQEAATTTIKDFDVLHLRDQAREVFINAVLNPPAPNEAARAAAERYKKHMEL